MAYAGEPIQVTTEEPMLEGGKKEGRKGRMVAVLGFIGLQLAVIAGEIVTLSGKTWTTYCFWNFSLLYGHSQVPSEFHSGYIFPLRSDYCDADRTVAVSDYCKLFCTNGYLLGIYGYVALFCGVLTVLITLPSSQDTSIYTG